MQLRSFLAAASVLALAAFVAPSLRSEPPPSEPASLDASTPHGRYVEARTAAVFAGACHYGAQLTTQGREAVVAFGFDGGFADGLPLAGIDVVCAIAGDANLAADEQRRSIVYVSKDVDEARRAAAVRLVRTRYARLLGEVRDVRAVSIVHRVDESGYSVAIPAVLTVEGRLVPDRCCKMEQQVWYAPFGKSTRGTAELAQLGERLGGGDVFDVEIGCNDRFRYGERSLGPVWERFEENNGFVGRFAFRPQERP